jgi:hypothetical protein
MNAYIDSLTSFLQNPPIWFIVIASITAFITIVAQMALFEKCHREWWAALIPGYNIVVFLQIIGRPSWQILYFLIPVYNIIFGFKLLIEICQCLGQTKTVDYVLAVLLTGLYVFHLAMSEDIKYHGPIYQSIKKAA